MRADWIRNTPFHRPLAAGFDAATRLRNALYDNGTLKSFKARLPVISVGNITVGGSGKSPFAQYLAAGLKARGLRPALLLRGYGGSTQGPHAVCAADRVEDVGDEALMHRLALAADIAVVICRDRVTGAEFIAERKLGDIVVLDDGFQHRRLRRSCDLVLIDPSVPAVRESFSARLLLPAGVLREDPSRALTRADAVIFVGAGELAGVNLSAKYQFRFHPGAVTDLYSVESVAPKSLRAQSVSVFTAIANPERFRAAVSSLGGAIDTVSYFPDHHLFTAAEFEAASRRGLLVVTAKDAVKIRHYVRGAGSVFVLGQTGAFTAAEEGFWALVQGKINASR
jgi:tetraacyldisaccharide 4'-kinase